MKSIPIYVGLDYHQSKIQVCVLDQEGNLLANRFCGNDWEEVRKRVEGKGRVAGVAIESCSGAANLADELIQYAKWPVHLAHPGYVSRMKQSPDKSDFTDARMLADLERVGYLPKVWLAPEAIRELRMLVRYRQQLVNERRATKLRIGAVLREQRLRNGSYHSWTRPWMEWLRHGVELSTQGRWVVDRHIERLEWVIQKVVEAQKRLKAVTQGDPMVKQLCSFKGIGEVTAWTIRAEIGRFDRFTSGKQLARYCGLSPRNASSGNRQADAGLIKAGNGPLRGVLIEAAHRLARFDPYWSKMNFRMRDRGKKGSVVAAAIANRWMRWLYHQMKNAPNVA